MLCIVWCCMCVRVFRCMCVLACVYIYCLQLCVCVCVCVYLSSIVRRFFFKHNHYWYPVTLRHGQQVITSVTCNTLQVIKKNTTPQNYIQTTQRQISCFWWNTHTHTHTRTHTHHYICESSLFKLTQWVINLASKVV